MASNSLVEILAEARRLHQPLPPAAETLAPASLDAAYAVQDTLHAALRDALGDIVGYKIGCTTPVMQKTLGIDHPSAGGIFARTRYESGADIRRSDFVTLGVESEVAVRLGRDVTPDGAPYTRASVAPLVDAYVPAIELVDDRYRAMARPPVPLLVADDFYGAGLVTGSPRRLDPDAVVAVRTSLYVDGTLQGTGTADAVLGHPLEALAWLANHLAARGATLPAGFVVTLGAIVASFWITEGAHTVEVVHEGLGAVRIHVA
jgi:2-keto-4-pentenoate hydratase